MNTSCPLFRFFLWGVGWWLIFYNPFLLWEARKTERYFKWTKVRGDSMVDEKKSAGEH